MKFSIFYLIILTGFQVFAHGEDKPGPHGGKIEMAKNVHTEVAADKDGSFHIFLLDGNLLNPTVKNSSLDAAIKTAGNETKLNCSVMGGTHYHCKSKGLRPKEGQLSLKANRDGVSVDVSYDLKTFDEKTMEKKESSHH